jgi:hypothetical protein
VKTTTHAFLAGELEKGYYARNNLEKYDQGVALARNFLVDFRGGLKTRPGTQFCDYVEPNTKLLSFNTDDGQSDLMIVMSPQRLRVITPSPLAPVWLVSAAG